MKRPRHLVFGLMSLVAGLALLAGSPLGERPVAEAKAKDTVRFSTFNASLNRFVEGQLITDLSTPDNAQAKIIAEIIQVNSGIRSS